MALLLNLALAHSPVSRWTLAARAWQISALSASASSASLPPPARRFTTSRVLDHTPGSRSALPVAPARLAARLPPAATLPCLAAAAVRPLPPAEHGSAQAMHTGWQSAPQSSHPVAAQAAPGSPAAVRTTRRQQQPQQRRLGHQQLQQQQAQPARQPHQQPAQLAQLPRLQERQPVRQHQLPARLPEVSRALSTVPAHADSYAAPQAMSQPGWWVSPPSSPSSPAASPDWAAQRRDRPAQAAELPARSTTSSSSSGRGAAPAPAHSALAQAAGTTAGASLHSPPVQGAAPAVTTSALSSTGRTAGSSSISDASSDSSRSCGSRAGAPGGAAFTRWAVAAAAVEGPRLAGNCAAIAEWLAQRLPPSRPEEALGRQEDVLWTPEVLEDGSMARVTLAIGGQAVEVMPLWVAVHQPHDRGVARLYESTHPLDDAAAGQLVLSGPLLPFAEAAGLSFSQCDARAGAWRNYFIGVTQGVAAAEEDVLWPNQVFHGRRTQFNLRHGLDLAKFLADPKKEDIESHLVNLRRFQEDKQYEAGWCWHMLRKRWGEQALHQFKVTVEQ